PVWYRRRYHIRQHRYNKYYGHHHQHHHRCHNLSVKLWAVQCTAQYNSRNNWKQVGLSLSLHQHFGARYLRTCVNARTLFPFVLNSKPICILLEALFFWGHTEFRPLHANGLSPGGGQTLQWTDIALGCSPGVAGEQLLCCGKTDVKREWNGNLF